MATCTLLAAEKGEGTGDRAVRDITRPSIARSLIPSWMPSWPQNLDLVEICPADEAAG